LPGGDAAQQTGYRPHADETVPQLDELVGTLVWLISEASKFATGVVVPIDGGFNAYSGA